MNTYFKTSERAPTQEDAQRGFVLIWEGKRWASSTLEGAGHYEYWQPQPPPPKSASDEAFEKWVNSWPARDVRSSKGVWDAAIAWKESQK